MLPQQPLGFGPQTQFGAPKLTAVRLRFWAKAQRRLRVGLVRQIRRLNPRSWHLHLCCVSLGFYLRLWMRNVEAAPPVMWVARHEQAQ